MILSRCILVLILITGCGYSKSVLVKSNVSDDYKNSTYGTMIFNRLIAIESEGRLNYYIKEYRDAVTTRDNMDKLTDAQKNDKLNKINSIKFEKNRFYTFEIQLKRRVPDKDAVYGFEIKDSKNNKVPAEIYYLPWIGYVFWDDYTEYFYNYIWVVKTSVPVTSENFGKDKTPLHLHVSYPNGQSEVYDISP